MKLFPTEKAIKIVAAKLRADGRLGPSLSNVVMVLDLQQITSTFPCRNPFDRIQDTLNNLP